MSDFASSLKRLRASVGLSQGAVAHQLEVSQSAVSKWEKGTFVPDADTVRALDRLLGGADTLTLLATPNVVGTGGAAHDGEPVTAEYVERIRASIAHLVALDGQHGGADLVPMATRLHRTAAEKLNAGAFPESLRSDFAAAVAELAQVGGWLAFDAIQNDQARQFNDRALSAARFAGDRDMELFVIGNMSLLSQESGHAKDALRRVQLMQSYELSPRMRSMTWMRQARAAADLGDERALPLIQRAHKELETGVSDRDPAWAWWINDTEMLVQEAACWRALGRLDRAVDLYAAGWESYGDDYRWGRVIGGASLADVLAQVGDWDEVERVVAEVLRFAEDTQSARAAHRLRRAVGRSRQGGAPESVHGVLSKAAHMVTP